MGLQLLGSLDQLTEKFCSTRETSPTQPVVIAPLYHYFVGMQDIRNAGPAS